MFFFIVNMVISIIMGICFGCLFWLSKIRKVQKRTRFLMDEWIKESDTYNNLSDEDKKKEVLGNGFDLIKKGEMLKGRLDATSEFFD